MPEQVSNPLKFWCAPNQSTPDYVAYDDFRSWVAYGLMTCWLGTSDNDPNSDCHMARPITREDVEELRSYFLDLVETVIASIWKGDYKPGDGSIDGNWQSVNIGNSDENPDEEETILTWYVRLDDDCMMFEMQDGSDGIAIWLNYEAIADRKKVLSVLTEARNTLDELGGHNQVWQTLVDLVELDLTDLDLVEPDIALS